MKTIVQQKVTRSATMPDEVFNRIINNAVCDTSDLEQIGFTATHKIDENDKGYIIKWHVNFYGNDSENHILRYDECYRELIPSFGKPVIEKYYLDAGQILHLQGLIYRQRDDLQSEMDEAYAQSVRDSVYNAASPYDQYGLKEAMFI